MSNTQDITYQIEQLRQQKQASLQAEAERKRAENAHLQAAQDTEAEIQALEAQRAESAFQDAINRNADFISRQGELQREMMTLFEAALKALPELQQVYDDAKANFDAQQNHNNTALYNWRLAKGRQLAQDSDIHRASQNATKINMQANQQARNLPTCIHPADFLMQTVARRIGISQDHAAGITASLMGDYERPGKDFSAETASNQRASRIRSGRA